MTNAIGRLGRRIRLGLVGGGGNALIGPVHRIAARMDDRIEIVAAILSSNREKSLAEAKALGIARPYGDIDEMIAREAGRPDGIDAVAIMTPNDSHAELAARALAAGWDVLCEKPLANTLADGQRVAEAAAASGRILCLAHNYSGYPMVREARAAIAAGEIGTVHLLQVSYLQGTLGARVEATPERMPDRMKWRLDPARGGPSHVLGDIGTHAHQLATFVAGLPVARVLADVGSVFSERHTHDTASVILRMQGGARGQLIASKAASGADNRIAIEVYGDLGGLRWEQALPNQLQVMRQGKAMETRFTGQADLHPLARQSARLPQGHPEAFLEAFANLYSGFAERVAARMLGEGSGEFGTAVPEIEDGLAGLAFIDACLTSSAHGGWVDCTPPSA